MTANHLFFIGPPTWLFLTSSHQIIHLAAAELPRFVRCSNTHEQPWRTGAHVRGCLVPQLAGFSSTAHLRTPLHWALFPTLPLHYATPKQIPTKPLMVPHYKLNQYIGTGFFCFAKKRLLFLNLNQLSNWAYIVVQQAVVPQTSILLKEKPWAKHFALLPEEEVPHSLCTRLLANILVQVLEAGTVS